MDNYKSSNMQRKSPYGEQPSKNDISKDKKVNLDKIRIIRSAKSWIEGSAVQQLERIAGLQGVTAVVGLPDLHPGKGFPIGAAFAARDWIYPFYVGNDIGCGISLWQLDLKHRKAKKEKLVKRLETFESQDISDQIAPLPEGGLTRNFLKDLGTIGGSNHFAELQVVEQVFNQTLFDELALDKERLMLVVHSGSRSLGESILRGYVDQHRDQGVTADSPEGQDYLDRHNAAIEFAEQNRMLIAQRVLMALGTSGSRVTDTCHNCIAEGMKGGQRVWIHRKGAARSDQGAVIIPGSRGTLSYLVMPIGDQKGNLWSIPHGAGRKFGRNDIKARLKGKISKDQLRQTRIGGQVICDDNELLFEEAPEGYKDIDRVVNDMIEAGIVEIIATLKPVVTYKKWTGR
jgi:release factor H-coupled RctB family protein